MLEDVSISNCVLHSELLNTPPKEISDQKWLSTLLSLNDSLSDWKTRLPEKERAGWRAGKDRPQDYRGPPARKDQLQYKMWNRSCGKERAWFTTYLITSSDGPANSTMIETAIAQASESINEASSRLYYRQLQRRRCPKLDARHLRQLEQHPAYRLSNWLPIGNNGGTWAASDERDSLYFEHEKESTASWLEALYANSQYHGELPCHQQWACHVS
ncbi:hypothetical protein AC579_10076 [Pseudocercospora musae]|uniref:Uncharacterized protein n=1 Tax=Pseudocercospora musae TaxID=113226 RepID=A0A139IG02_9PEZI|nr:hypothetical protein AC579_10076 [Pseudocercospora musae]